MKKIEAVVGADGLGSIRDALREIGIRTMRVSEVEEEVVPVLHAAAAGTREPERGLPAKARVSVVVSDDLTDRVILLLLANLKGEGIDDGDRFVSSIEHVVRLEAAGYFDDIA